MVQILVDKLIEARGERRGRCRQGDLTFRRYTMEEPKQEDSRSEHVAKQLGGIKL